MRVPDGFSFEQEVSRFLAARRTASLATVGGAVDAHEEPHAANVQYVHGEDFRLYWVSSPGSEHSADLERNPRAALTVYGGGDERMEDIHGVQMRGSVATVAEKPSAAWQRVWGLYVAKFSFVADNAQLCLAIEQQRFYCFTPTWMRWIDNRRGFGWKAEKSI